MMPNTMYDGRFVKAPCKVKGDCPFEGNFGACCDGSMKRSGVME